MKYAGVAKVVKSVKMIALNDKKCMKLVKNYQIFVSNANAYTDLGL